MGNIALINGNIIPMDGRKRWKAVLAIDGKIEATGSNEEILNAVKAYSKDTSEIKVLDVNGATVLPGFHDCHAHLSLTGYNAQGINMYDAKDIPEVIERLKEAEATWAPERWLFGKRLDEGLLSEKRPPTMEELDIFDRPVFLSDRGGHYVVVNRAAFDALGIDEDMNGVRKDAEGRPNGRLQDKANKVARNGFPWTKEQTLEAMRWAGEEALKKGITTVHAQEGFTMEDPAVPLLLENLKDFPIDVVIFWCTMPDADEPMAEQIGILGGDILLDGSIGSRTAAFYDNYCDGDGCGYLNFTIEEVNDFVENGIVRDLAMSFHVIGEKAAAVALDAYERALELHPDKKETAKLRLEHFGWQTKEDMERAAKMDVRISTQPAFTYLRGGPESIYRSRLGEEREKAGYSLRDMLDAGLCLGGGSDSDITPMDALLGIHAAVNPPYPENAATPYEAVRMYTSDAAKNAWEDSYKGKLIPGMQADMVILDADPMTVNPQTIKDIRILGTVRKGKLVYNDGIE
ncbi:MAG: amidohydrolase [Lachnospiraceae bacterium]|nr:amidohydrolase [Lachnospiraceae bacterium]